MAKPKTVLGGFVKEVVDTYLTGDTREESFYPALAKLIQEAARSTNRAEIKVTILPRPTEGGNPDFRVWNGSDRVVGYIEAKRLEEDLERIEDTEQLRRYRATFPNLILTNFLEFRLYREGQLTMKARLARPFVLTELHTTPPLEGIGEVWTLLENYLGFALPRTISAEGLAVELAKRTRFLRDVVYRLLMQKEEDGEALFGFYEAFRKFLLGELSSEEFADLYAQTITYGLFAARTRARNGFNRRLAYDNIPQTVGILRDLFRFISWGDLPTELEWIVDDIASLLDIVNVTELLSRYYREGKGDDPVIHFYETFLAQYDPEERERRGVYYTPDPIVSYIVRSIHLLLKERFGKADGLAAGDVTLLDPAAGTMTFVARAAETAVREFEDRYGTGAREEFIRKHILQNYYAFELMMAPYTVGHLKMAFFLEELGHRLEENERVPFYLTNTLDMTELEKSPLPGFSSLAHESRLAGRVKKEQPILVILGNPPYSGHSANKGKWIRQQIEIYKKVDGRPLGEKNPKWLQDDYVKFLRFAQWKIEGAGRGLVGMITNHSYLDNPTFRGMRRSLMETFDEIYILDLHGNSLKKEITPDGGKDENVFDIRQGVAIAFFLKTGTKTVDPGRVYHTELWGLREEKYRWLQEHDFAATPWKELVPTADSYLFIPSDEATRCRYETYPKISELLPLSSVGIVTARDNLTIQWTPDGVWSTVLSFMHLEPELARQAYNLGEDVRDWKVTLAQEDLQRSGPDRKKIVPILYRPFDVRYTYYTGHSRGFHCMPRREVMQHMLTGKNLALIVPRRVEHMGDWQHAFVTQLISDHVAVSLKTIDYHFPLYLYSDHQGLFEGLKEENHQAWVNLNPRLLSILKETYKDIQLPKEIFAYVYAVLFAPAYRAKYRELLRTDFPRIPFPTEARVFKELAALGSRLIDLHLLRSKELDPPLVRFDGAGDNRVERARKKGFHYDTKESRVYINASQYFAPIPSEVWEYCIGGYQVPAKWLKDREGRILKLEEVQTYCRIITALIITREIQCAIDEIYPEIENTALRIRL